MRSDQPALEQPPDAATQRRLAALRETGLLDSPSEPAFDRLTRLAARLLDVPVALVSLLDRDRQVFKGQQGLAEPWATRRETPFSHSFCQHVVADDSVLMVTDARADPRLCNNLAIPDLSVIAYLGVPLRMPDGQPIGAVCAIDSRPRCWSEADVALLHDLAEIAASEVALRLELRQRQRAEAELGFLHLLGRELAAIDSPCALVRHAVTRLGAQLGASLAGLDDVDLAAGIAIANPGFRRDRDVSGSSRYPLEFLGDALAEAAAGEMVVVSNVGTDPRAAKVTARAGELFGAGAWIIAPLQQKGVWSAFVIVACAEPRDWTEGEVRLVRAVADLAWPALQKVRTLAALRESEERQRLALAAGDMGTWSWDPTTRVTVLDRRERQLLGLPDEGDEFSIDAIAKRFHPDDRPQMREAMVSALTGERDYRSEFRVVLPSGEIRWLAARGRLQQDGVRGHKIMLGLNWDITDLKLAEERLRLILFELDHRAKNMLSVIQSIVAQSSMRAKTVEGFRAALEGRLRALAVAHEALAANGWRGVRLLSIVRTMLAAYLGRAERLRLDLDDVLLGPRLAQGLSLTLHELATNAARHGALSNADGHVTLTGRTDDGRRQLTLVWREQGGPPIEVPSYRGFGTLLLSRALSYESHARVVLDWPPEGLVCQITMPLDGLAEPSS